MVRMTLHEAQTAVDAIRKRNNLREPGWRVNLDDPMGEAVRYAILSENIGYASLEKAAKDISAALLAYKAHLDFEAGKAFAEAAIIRHADSKGDVDLVREIREGLHYAEPEETHQ